MLSSAVLMIEDEDGNVVAGVAQVKIQGTDIGGGKEADE